MENKTICAEYSVTEEEARAAYRLSGEEKDRFIKNRNTTIWFVLIMLLFGYSIYSNLTGEKTPQSNGFLMTYIVFEVLCAVMIAAAWLGGKNVVKASFRELCNGTKLTVYINENGISLSAGEEEIAFGRGDFTVKQDETMFLIEFSGKRKLIIPKRVFSTDDLSVAAEHLEGKAE